MEFLLLRIAVALAGAGAAAWQDARTSFIDDRITVSMIAVGAALCAVEAWNAVDKTPWLWVGAVALFIAVAGFFAWRAGQFGGGDVLLFLGIHLLLPFNPTSAGAALPYPFVVSVLVAASFLGAVWSAAWYAKRLRDEHALSAVECVGSALGFAACFLVFRAWLSFSIAQSVFFALLFAAAFFLSFFKKRIMKRVVVKRLRLRDAEDEDVLALEEIPKRLIARYSIGRVLTHNEVVKLRRVERVEGVRSWPVCKELPRFAPFVFAGLVACLLVGDVVLFFLFN